MFVPTELDNKLWIGAGQGVSPVLLFIWPCFLDLSLLSLLEGLRADIAKEPWEYYSYCCMMGSLGGEVSPAQFFL